MISARASAEGSYGLVPKIATSIASKTKKPTTTTAIAARAQRASVTMFYDALNPMLALAYGWASGG
jgi:hypothetical protein